MVLPSYPLLCSTGHSTKKLMKRKGKMRQEISSDCADWSEKRGTIQFAGTSPHGFYLRNNNKLSHELLSAQMKLVWVGKRVTANELGQENKCAAPQMNRERARLDLLIKRCRNEVPLSRERGREDQISWKWAKERQRLAQFFLHAPVLFKTWRVSHQWSESLFPSPPTGHWCGKWAHTFTAFDSASHYFAGHYCCISSTGSA